MNLSCSFRRIATMAGIALLLTDSSALGAVSDWSEKMPLTPTGGGEGDQFGAAVAVGKGIIAVGAYLADANDSGSVYLFIQDKTGAWSQCDKRSGKNAGEWFGFDVAISANDQGGHTLVIGAPKSEKGLGKAYVYDLTHDSITAQCETKNERTLEVGSAVDGDELGSSVATDGDWVVVGARGADRRAGRIYVFSAGGDHTTTLGSPKSVPGREFGQSMALSGTTLIVGEPLPGENGQSNGAAYAFKLDKEGKLNRLDNVPESPQGLTPKAAFGYSVAISGDKIMVGAPLTNQESGAVYRLSGGKWELLPSPSQKGSQLGAAIAVSGNEAIIGARRGKKGAGTAYSYTWGDQPVELDHTPKGNDEFGFGAAINGDVLMVGAFKEDGRGAAYVFERSAQTVTLSFTLGTDAAKPDKLEILNIDAAEGVEIVASAVLETNDGGALRNPVTVTVESKGTAEAGSDYMFSKGEHNSDTKHTFVFEPGKSLSHKIPLSVLTDCVDEEEETFTLSLSGSPEAQVGNPSKLKVSIQDSDLVGDIDIIPPPRELRPWTTSESGTPKTFGVKLTCKPASKVFLALASTKESEGKVKSDRSLVFSPENWSTEQLVTVKGQDDRACDGLVAYKIELTTTSDDPGYDRPDDPKEVDLENEDNGDVCPEATVCSAGGTIVYTVRIENTSGADQGTLPGPEILEQLPTDLTVVTASADLGVVTTDYIRNEVAWNGSIAKDAIVTIQIIATLEPNVDPEIPVTFRGTYHYGSREASFEVTFHVGETDPCLPPE
ncbi:MAG: hypothetical protein QOH06_2217 [Acidobacteriota bacterium]|jgi:hypothetical protein|nr:hypothetical protein [Acidobacteriota bacterium]